MPLSQTHSAHFDHPLIRALVTVIDRTLRRRQGVEEFTHAPDCIFRIETIRADARVSLSDGTLVRPGDRIIDLHLWNEHVPLMPAAGPTLTWARQMSRGLDVSLRELAAYLARRQDLGDVVALRAQMKFGSAQQSDQLARISGHYGFEKVEQRGPLSLGERLHLLGDSILISMIVLARNAAAFRLSGLWRDCTVVYLSRRTLLRRYGPGRT